MFADMPWGSEDAVVLIEDLEDAFEELDHPEGIPFDAIRFGRAADSSGELMDRIILILENAYNRSLQAEDIFHYASPLWYAIVAEAHLDERLIAPAVHLITNVSIDDEWDFLIDEAQYLVCSLAEKYPDKTAEVVMSAIDAVLELGLQTPYLFLFDVFLIVDAKKYEKWLLRVMQHPKNMWQASLAVTFTDIKMTAAEPVLRKVIDSFQKNEKPGLHPDYDEIRDIEESLEILQGIREPYDESPQPEFKNRGDWEAYYLKFEDRFETDNDLQDD